MIETPVGFIGAGNMAEALIRSLVETGTCPPQMLFASDVDSIRRTRLSQNYGIHTTADNRQLAQTCPILVLAVKPQQVPAVMAGLAGALEPSRHVLISIAAGITTSYLEKAAGRPVKIIRIMPNTPARVRAGATAFCLGRHAGPDERKLAEEIFAASGIVMPVEENLMDAVTAVSGSGPAYVFYLCELMCAGGEALGLNRRQSEQLAVQTIIGAARMLAESGQNAAELRAAVTSAGGTTEAALRHLEAADFGGIFTAAMRAARDRARDLTPAEPEAAG